MKRLSSKVKGRASTKTPEKSGKVQRPYRKVQFDISTIERHLESWGNSGCRYVITVASSRVRCNWKAVPNGPVSCSAPLPALGAIQTAGPSASPASQSPSHRRCCTSSHRSVGTCCLIPPKWLVICSSIWFVSAITVVLGRSEVSERACYYLSGSPVSFSLISSRHRILIIVYTYALSKLSASKVEMVDLISRDRGSRRVVGPGCMKLVKIRYEYGEAWQSGDRLPRAWGSKSKVRDISGWAVKLN